MNDAAPGVVALLLPPQHGTNADPPAGRRCCSTGAGDRRIMVSPDIHRSRVTRRSVVTLATALCLVGCEPRFPTAPAIAHPGLEVDARLGPAWRMVDEAIPTTVRRVSVAATTRRSGWWDAGTGTVWIGTHLLEAPSVIVAGVLVHELAHAEGLVHSCGDGPGDWTDDRTLEGAWGRQARFLDRHGRRDLAALIRREHICAPD